MMKVVHCAETIKGGVASYLRELIRLQARDFGADSVALVIPASQKDELPVPPGVRVRTYPDHRGRAGNAFVLAHAVLAEVGESAPEIVHVHCTYAGATVRPLLWLFSPGTRLIYCPHGWAFSRPLAQPAHTLVRLVERLLATVTESIVCISEFERRFALRAGIRSDRLRLVLNGVAAARPEAEGEPPSWKPGRIRLLFAGRFDHAKGADIFVAALRLLGDKVHAVVAGETVLADGIPFAVPDNASLAGWLSPGQLERHFDTADVLVVPSRYEGFSLVAAEAMRAGLAVIATRVGGLPEVVADGVCGLIIEPGSAAALAQCIETRQQSDWQRLGRNGPERVRTLFAMERVHRQLSALYASGAGRGPANSVE